MYRETKAHLILVSAHGAEGYVMNRNTSMKAMADFQSDKHIPIPAGMRLDIKKLVADIKALDNYTATKPVRLDICKAGKGGAASVGQQVAEGLVTNPVTANTGDVKPDTGKGTGDWVDFNSAASGRPTNVLNPSVRSYPHSSSEIGHGASMNRGEQAREDPTVKPADYIKQPSESKSDSLKVEDAVRKLENLKPRD